MKGKVATAMDQLTNRSEVPPISFIEVLVSAQLSGVNSYLTDKKHEHKAPFEPDLKYEYIPAHAQERSIRGQIGDNLEGTFKKQTVKRKMGQVGE